MVFPDADLDDAVALTVRSCFNIAGQGCNLTTRMLVHIEPTVLADVDPLSDVAQQEVFGPVLSIIPFDDEDEAVELANGTPYGLGTYLQTRDVSRVHRLVRRFQSGSVHVNGVSGQPPGAPFGGYKQSGTGREGGREGLFEFLQTKNVYIRA
ncbi:aldehyde dehydrogenase [Actinomadura sp. WMMB 499]|uniref:aldehyde dehydrogenase family protein n=1 Tax=Actinomadura sp. WMMB 499 TaxID=1219491 RepID=UPI001C3F647B|nr:aldehyde dehydrogenase family protein [Actinomadura sp. WMMB 499]